VDPDPATAAATVARDREAALAGDARAQVALGDRYMEGRGVPFDATEAFRWFQAAAEQGDLTGQLRLGFMYEHGQGTAQDIDEAHNWYTQAAAQGDPAAQANLGDLFESGEGYTNPKVAAYWYRQAARQGYAAAQLDLGRLYEAGRGVPQDYVAAYVWYALAAARGNQAALRNRDLVSAKLSPAEIAEARRQAREWQPKPPARPP
jgi:TPR repeat protein